MHIRIYYEAYEKIAFFLILFKESINVATQSIPRTTASMNLTRRQESKSQEDIYKAKTLGNLNHIRILKDSTIKYKLEEPQFLSHKGFNIDKRIIFIS